MKQISADFLLKKNLAAWRLRAKTIRENSWLFVVPFLFKNFAAWRLRAKKNAFPQPKPRERKIIHIKKKSFRTFYERERRRRTATSASPPIPANNPNADGSGISGNGSVGFSDRAYS